MFGFNCHRPVGRRRLRRRTRAIVYRRVGLRRRRRPIVKNEPSWRITAGLEVRINPKAAQDGGSVRGDAATCHVEGLISDHVENLTILVRVGRPGLDEFKGGT